MVTDGMLSSWQNKAERVILDFDNYIKQAAKRIWTGSGSLTIILINGQQLTEYIYDYGLGLQTEKVLKVMKMDMDYWDAMDNAWWYCAMQFFYPA